MRREIYRGETTTHGHQHNARMSRISPIRTLTSACAFTEMFLHHPRSALRFFCFFFFLRLDGNAAMGFHEDQVNSVPKAVTTTTNDLYSLELSSGLHRGKPFMAAVAVGAPGL